jgi:ribonuclease R
MNSDDTSGSPTSATPSEAKPLDRREATSTRNPQTTDELRSSVLAALRGAPAQGLRADELVTALGVDAKGKHRVRRLLSDLIDENSIEKGPGGRYRLVGAAPAAEATPTGERGDGGGATAPTLRPGQIPGRLRVHPAGYGFVVRDDGEDDVFVPARFRGHAMDGDRVALSTWLGYKGTEGRVEAVLERGRAKLTGVVREVGPRGRRAQELEPDDPRVAATSGTVLLEDDGPPARPGDAVVAEITRYPSRADEPIVARVLRVLGDPDDPRTEIEKSLICGDIPVEFPDDVLQAAARAPTEVRPEDLVDRADLRDRVFLTIDPETARDFDDAICVEPSPRPGCTRLWVAVADVSHYVRPHEALDREARVRGCSVYLPDRAIPMLPRELSSHICSLNPEVDRLAMVVRMEIDPHGAVLDPSFCAAVIRSRARLDYAGVAAALAGDLRGPRARYREHLPVLEEIREVARRIRALRTARGALDFELPEAKVVLDEDDPRRVRDVVQSRANPEVKGAYQIVEDCMLAANEAVARFFAERGLDTLWRVHDVPTDERLEQFAELAQSFGLRFEAADGRDPKRVRDFMRALDARDVSPGVKRSLHFLLLRALKQAQYDVVNVGHFGLGARDYLHFTSPIRRYPDLVVHRLLKHALHRDGLPAGGPPPSPPTRVELARTASDASTFERRAMEVEREIVDMYRAFLMREHVGEDYEGTVAGVASFGLFVQIDSPFVEGLVKLENIDGDSWEYDEERMRLVGRRSGRAFSLGDTVRVEIASVSVPRRKIDLRLVEHLTSTAEALGSLPGRHAPPPRRQPKRGERPVGKGDGKRGERRRFDEGRGGKHGGRSKHADTPGRRGGSGSGRGQRGPRRGR